MPTLVVNRRYEPYDVYVGRGSIWGNPYSSDPHSSAKYQTLTRDAAIEKYAEWIQTQPQLLARLRELKNKTLGCWCAPRKCHAEILADLADALPELPTT